MKIERVLQLDLTPVELNAVDKVESIIQIICDNVTCSECPCNITTSDDRTMCAKECFSQLRAMVKED